VKIKIFDGRRASHELEHAVNMFCRRREVLSVNIGQHDGYYDLIVVYKEGEGEKKEDENEVQQKSYRGDAEVYRLYQVVTRGNAEARESTYQSYIGYIAALHGERGWISRQTIADAVGITISGIKRRDKSIAKALGREVDTFAEVASRLGLPLS